MSQVWDVSVLVDDTGRVLEARGQANLHFGLDGQSMVGKQISNYIAESDRAHFSRFFRLLGNTRKAPGCLVHLNSPTYGDRNYVMQSETGQAANTFWLLFAVGGAITPVQPIGDIDVPSTFADNERLLRLIELAATEGGATLDLTVIAIAALRDRRRLRKLSSEQVDSLESALENAILEGAQDGIAGKSAAGEYSFLQSPSSKAEDVTANILNVADRYGVKEADLGVASATVQVKAGTSVTELKAAIANAVQYVRDDMEDFDRNSTSGDKMKVIALGAIAAILGAAIGTVLAFM
jgi:hypothetical protein